MENAEDTAGDAEDHAGNAEDHIKYAEVILETSLIDGFEPKLRLLAGFQHYAEDYIIMLKFGLKMLNPTPKMLNPSRKC